MLPILILTVGILSRLVWHMPNFTPVLALALFAGVYLDRRISVIFPLALMMISDLILGVYPGIGFTWAAVAVIPVLGWFLQQRKNAVNVLGFSVLSSILFFFVSNLGVWLAGGLYPLTPAGLADCFVMAIPFFKNTLLSTVVYSVVLISGYDFLKCKVQGAKCKVS